MKKKITTRKPGKKDRTDWKRVDALKDADIAKAIHDDPDTVEADSAWFRDAMVLRPVRDKEPITVRLDSDMVAWFRGQGRGYQTRINAILRAYFETHGGENGLR